MTPQFLYFDLGNVLLPFSHERMARQMAEVAGIAPERVWQLVFEGNLQDRCERGDLNARELYSLFCQETQSQPEFAALERAGSDIFTLNASILPLVNQLSLAGYPLGILSNTSSSHWEFVTDGHYSSLLPGPFEKIVLSYEVRSMKPDREIYDAAADVAGVSPEKIFFTDDRPENVAGAIAAGWDAVLFENTSQLAGELRRRGVRFNY